MQSLNRVAGAAALALVAFGAAAAQRTFVASFGSDANTCSIAQPCRTFTKAKFFTDINGEIVVLDSAGYGAIDIDKAMSIIAPAGIYAAISGGVLAAILIDAPANARVVLRGLAIQGATKGIEILQAGQVDIDRCTIANVSQIGIWARTTSQLTISDTRVDGSGTTGIIIRRGDAIIDRVFVENSTYDGIFVDPDASNSVQALIRDSVLARNGYSGLSVIASSTSSAYVSVENTAAVRNVFSGFSGGSAGGPVSLAVSRSIGSLNNQGVTASGVGAIVSVSHSTITRNYSHDFIQEFGAALRSHGNNAWSADGPSNISGTITHVGLQ
jgi:hypothetical protein